MEVPTHASWFFSVFFFFWLVHATGKLSLGCTVLRKIQQSPAKVSFYAVKKFGLRPLRMISAAKNRSKNISRAIMLQQRFLVD